MHDRQAKCARKVNKAARTLAGWLDVWREAVRDGDWDAAWAAKRQVLEAEAQLERARRCTRERSTMGAGRAARVIVQEVKVAWCRWASCASFGAAGVMRLNHARSILP